MDFLYAYSPLNCSSWQKISAMCFLENYDPSFFHGLKANLKRFICYFPGVRFEEAVRGRIPEKDGRAVRVCFIYSKFGQGMFVQKFI